MSYLRYGLIECRFVDFWEMLHQAFEVESAYPELGVFLRFHSFAFWEGCANWLIALASSKIRDIEHHRGW